MRNRKERFYSSVDVHRDVDQRKEISKKHFKRKTSPDSHLFRDNLQVNRIPSQPALEYRPNVLHGFG